MSRSRKPWPDNLGPTPPARTTRIKCGWCMAGQHDGCNVSVYSVLTNQRFICTCNATRHEEEQ